VLLFRLARRLLSRASDPWWHEHATAAAAWGAALWLVHPVHSQAVIYTWQRSTVLCTVLYLAALLAYVGGRLAPTRGRRLRGFVVTVVCGAAALATKEIAGTLPAAIWLLEHQFLAVRPRTWRWGAVGAACAALALAAIAADYLGPRFLAMIEADFARRGFTPWERLLTESRVVLHYVSLVLVPHPSRLMVDYDVPLSRSIWSPPATALAVSAIGGALVLMIRLWRRRPLVAVAIAWFLGHLVIESTLIPLDLAYEHRLYLPASIPLVLAGGGLWRSLGPIASGRVALVLLLALLGTWTALRVEVWRDPVRLWQDNAVKAPQKARVQGQLGKACLERRDRDCAWRAFTRAVALDPARADAENGLASVLIDLDRDPARAEPLLRRLLEREPSYVPALVNLSVVQLRRGRASEAFETLSHAARIDPDNRLVLVNLASAALAVQRIDAAIAAAERGMAFWPRDAAFPALRGLAALAAGRTADAAADSAHADALDPRDPLSAMLRARLPN
jgi:tetratricopeptide (TPR) repeat protein